MLEDAPHHDGVIDQRNDVHRPSALGAFKLGRSLNLSEVLAETVFRGDKERRWVQRATVASHFLHVSVTDS